MIIKGRFIKDFFLILFIKFIIASLFLWYLLIYKNQEMLPMMIDQLRYVADIEMLDSNIGGLLLSDADYEANRTLYSRLAGFTAWLIPYSQPPILIAVYVNTLLHFFTALYALKIYQLFGGLRQRLFIFIVAFSPTFEIYSFFALRDIFISLVTTAFVYHLLTKKRFQMIVSLIMIVFLRPFFLAVFAFWYILNFSYEFVLKMKQRAVGIIISVVMIGVFAFTVNKFFAPESLAAYLTKDFDLVGLFVNALGLETFVTTKEGLRADRGTLNLVRILMYDSVLLPFMAFFILCHSLLIKRNADVIKISLLTVGVMFFVSYTYLAITDKFAFRKLLPMLPLMWVTLFVWIDSISSRSKNIVGQRYNGKG